MRYRLNPALDITKEEPQESRRLAFSVLLAGVLAPALLPVALYGTNFLSDAFSGRALAIVSCLAFVACGFVAFRMLFLMPTPVWIVSSSIAASIIVQMLIDKTWIAYIGLFPFLRSVACMIEDKAITEDIE